MMTDININIPWTWDQVLPLLLFRKSLKWAAHSVCVLCDVIQCGPGPEPRLALQTSHWSTWGSEQPRLVLVLFFKNTSVFFMSYIIFILMCPLFICLLISLYLAPSFSSIPSPLFFLLIAITLPIPLQFSKKEKSLTYCHTVVSIETIMVDWQ